MSRVGFLFISLYLPVQGERQSAGVVPAFPNGNKNVTCHGRCQQNWLACLPFRPFGLPSISPSTKQLICCRGSRSGQDTWAVPRWSLARPVGHSLRWEAGSTKAHQISNLQAQTSKCSLETSPRSTTLKHQAYFWGCDFEGVTQSCLHCPRLNALCAGRCRRVQLHHC